MSQKDIDKIKESFNDSVSWLQQQLGHVEESFNAGADQTAREFRKGISQLLDQAATTRVHVEDATSTAESHIKATEHTVLHHVRSTVKQGIVLAEEYPYAAYALAGVGLMAFPAPRSFVFRNVFGIFQSQESAFRGASERYATLAETSTTLLAGKEAAAETAGKALDDLAAAKTAATAAHAEVLALKSKLLTARNQLEGVQETLRPLKHKEVTELRADVAREASQVALSYKEVSRLVSKLQANGA